MTSDAVSVKSPQLQTQEYSGLGGLLHILRYFIPYLFPLWDKVLLRVLLASCVSFVSVWAAAAAGRVIDKGLIPMDTAAFQFWLLVGLGLAMTGCVLSVLIGIIAAYINIVLETRFRTAMYSHLQKHSLRFFYSRPVGEHMYRVNQDTLDAGLFLAGSFLMIVERFQVFILSIGVALAINPTVAYLVFGYLLLYIPVCHFAASYVRNVVVTFRIRIHESFASLQECLAGYPVSKAFAREKWSMSSYFHIMAETNRVFVKYLVANSLYTYLVNPLPIPGQRNDQTGILRIMFLFVGGTCFFGYQVIAGTMSTGEYVFTAGLVLQLVGPIEEIVFAISKVRIDSVAAERMLHTLEVEPEIQDAKDAIELAKKPCAIEFKDVSFRYAPELPDVAKGVSFRVEPGTKVALVGMSGAGKTSIFNILMRYYEPTGGSVLIGGHELSKLKLDSYRRQIGLVLQESHLFSATLRDNILMGAIDATPEQLQDAIDQAGIGELIQSLPDGLDTVISEAGNLSSGDRQRIAIARALIRDPQFFYLDEPTSALDPETTREIVKQLNKVVKGKTCLVIAHSLQMIVDADEIIVMDHGNVVQRGKHAALLEEGGLYHEMWEADLAKYGKFYDEDIDA